MIKARKDDGTKCNFRKGKGIEISSPCRRRAYRKDKCKQHFISTMMKDMRKEIRNLYRAADRAYAALDFSGMGYITE
jgi:hypothetical protein